MTTTTDDHTTTHDRKPRFTTTPRLTHEEGPTQPTQAREGNGKEGPTQPTREGNNSVGA